MPQALPVGTLVVYLGDRPPSPSDDTATIRARRGYWWVDRDASALWVCVDPAEDAAVWHRVGNAEDLAAIAWSGSWEDLRGTPDTLAGYGITDAATAEDLEAHEQASDNPHQVTAAQVGAPPLARIISAGTGLEGGGDLSEDRSFSLSTEVQASLALADTAVQPGDLAAIAVSGAWDDLGGTPTTLTGYGITDAARAADLAAHEQRADNPHGVTAEQAGADPVGSAAAAEGAARSYTDGQLLSLTTSLGTAAYQDLGAFDAAGSAAAVAAALEAHEQASDNPHAVTFDQVGADPAGAAGVAENNAKSYTDDAIGALGSAAQEQVGTQPLELTRNADLASGAFAPYQPDSLWPIVPETAHTLTPDDVGKIVWSAAHDITLPDTAAPGVEAGWRVWVRNTDPAASLTIDCAASDALDGAATLTLPPGESRLIAFIANGHYGSLR